MALCASKEVGIQPIQIIPLFNDDFKNWSTLITKGKAGDIRPIVRTFTNIVSNMTTLNHLIKLEVLTGGLRFALECMKPGILCLDLRVASLACKAVAGVVKELTDKRDLELAWKFFCKAQGGFFSVISCFETFKD